MTAQYSTDDGTTWRSAPVTGGGDRWILHVTDPAAGYVSLRATATGTAGGTATVTVIRAYGIK